MWDFQHLGLLVVKVVNGKVGGAQSPTNTFIATILGASTYGVGDDTQVVTWDKEIWSAGLNKSRARVRTMSTIQIHKVLWVESLWKSFYAID